MTKKKVLILTTSVFTDRIYQYSNFLKEFSKLNTVEIWARSFVSNPEDWAIDNLTVKPIPPVVQLRHWINLLRRINEFAWMYHLDAGSIKINLKHRKETAKNYFWLKSLGYTISILGLSTLFEKFLRFLILRNSKNAAINNLLKECNPDYIVVSNPFWVEEPLVALEAIKLKIPVISIVPSWDNITTKSRIIYPSNAYGVWSAVRVKELQKYYPESNKKPLFTYGTPQYDIFTNPEFINSKADFYSKYSLNQSLPIILFTLGSPLFITSEIIVCLEFCKKALEKELLHHYQILIRPHPIKDFSEFLPLFNEIDSRIKIQTDVQTSSKVKFRFQNKDMITNWVSSFYYSEIVIATSSTTILDASMMNKKHINIAANLTEDKTLDSFLKDISFGFEHLQSLNNKNLLNNIFNIEELIGQLIENIKTPEAIPNYSKEIVLHLAEIQNTGNYGELFAKNLNKTINQHLNQL